MQRIKIEKSVLKGEVSISGAKNSSLKLLTATILTKKEMRLKNVPCQIDDFKIHLEMLKVLGKSLIIEKSSVKVQESKIVTHLKWEGRSIRNTLLILGSLLTRHGKGIVPLPGGCKLGERKYDLHVLAMEKFGAKVWDDDKNLYAESKEPLVGTDIFLPIRSTGATENCILMGTLAKGKTKIWNPHIRPEIIDLIAMLNKMGAKIKVYGQESIEIEGVEELIGIEHECIPDNMEALTFAIGTAMTGGEVEIFNFPFQHLEIPLIHLRESGLNYYKSADNNSLIVKKSNVYPIEISTGPYPAINSDMQPLFAAYGLIAKGESKIVDLRFPGRYQYGKEFEKMGGKTKIEGDLFKIYGGETLTGADVRALDLRAGAALALCGLTAEGETRVNDFWQVQRGYENFILKLKKLGAIINEG